MTFTQQAHQTYPAFETFFCSFTLSHVAAKQTGQGYTHPHRIYLASWPGPHTYQLRTDDSLQIKILRQA